MSLNTKVGWLAGATSALLAGVAFAGTTPSDTDARIAALESQIKAIKADSGSNWLTASKSEEIRALVQESLADSATRASLLAAAGNAGYDKGFFLASDDGNYMLNIGGMSQFRYVYNNRDDNAADKDVAGFENRRTRLWFKGNLFDKDFSYNIMGEFDRVTGDFGLRDAYATWKLDDGWSLIWGQFKAPLIREELISAGKQLTVDRSYVNTLTTGGRVQGLALTYANDQFRFTGSFNDGAGSEDSSFDRDNTEYAFTARGEFMFGENAEMSWSQFDDYTSARDEEFGGLIGAAIHWQGSEDYSDNTDEVETVIWTVDAQLEFGGANLAAYVVGAHADTNGVGESVDQFGFVVQGGFMFNDKWEGFGRYEYYDFDIPGVEEWSAVTVGFNHYCKGHNMKWTTDLVWGLDPMPADAAGLGLLADGGVDEDQIAFRTQLQFIF